MKILSFRHGHDSSASLVIDGEIIADVAEERFSRIKNDTSFPLKAIEFCLKQGGITPEQLDVIAIPSLHVPPAFFTFFKVPVATVHNVYPKETKSNNGFFWKKRKKVAEEEVYIEPLTGVNIPILPLYQKQFVLSENCKVELVEHHLAHAASACYTSGFNEQGQKALVAILDGSGDDVSVSLWRFKGGKISELKKFGRNASLGWFYANATEAMGWRHGSDEWKVMGLAPYGKPKAGALKGFYPEFEEGELVRPHEYGSFGRWNDHGSNHYHGKDAAPLSKFFEELGPEDFAAEVQRVSEEQAFNVIMPWLKKENTRNLICAGGFFHNIKFNQKVWYTRELDFHYVFPNAGDSGLTIGAALHVHHTSYPNEKVRSLGPFYFGPKYSNDTIGKLLEERGITHQYFETITDITAKYLAKNYVVGWFQGRMESGPRALGGRSILMSPLQASNKDIINQKIKYREKFRPFAPAIPAEKMSDYLINPRPEYYMICSFEVKEEKRKKIPAVVHEDHTARPQMVIREFNPRYYDVITAFGEITGEPVVLNTSFNVKGEPIVCSPREAIKCFYDTGMDVLVLENYMILKDGVEKLF